MVTTNWEQVVEGKIADSKSRGSKKRGWVKFTKSWLTSSINYRMSLDEQAVFSKLIVMADEYGPTPGLISDNDFRAMPHEYLAHLASCPIDILETTIAKSITDDSIYENGHGLYLTHFDDYQFTEYDRQKTYRLKSGDNKQTIDEYVEAIKPEYPDVDIDKELEKFKLWWSEGKKELKRPKSAFRNWLDKAREFKKNNPKTTRGKHEHMVQR